MERELKLNIDSKGIRTGLDKVDTALKKTQRVGADTAKQIRVAFNRAGVGIAAAGAATTAVLTAMIVKSLAAGDALAKTADKIGITTEALATLNHQAELFTNSGGKAMAEALTKASKRLGEFNANGGGAAGIWLKKLNLDTMELASLSPDQLFNRYAESIRGLNSRGEQLAAISALMGDESRALIGIIDASAESLAAAAEDAELFGLALSRTDTAKMEIVNDSITRASALFDGFSNQLTIALAPALEMVISLFTDTARAAGGTGEVATGVADGIITAFGFVGNAIRGIQVIFKATALVFAKIAEELINTIFMIADGWRQLANLVPGINIGPMTALESTLARARDRTKELGEELSILAMEKLPSVQLGDLFEENKAAFQRDAEAAAGASSSEKFGAGGEAAEAEEAARKAAIKATENALAIEQEIAHTDVMLQLKRDYETEQTAIQSAAEDQRRRLTQMSLTSTASALSSLGQLLGGAGKKQSTAQKILAKSSIITSTAVAIMRAWELPWPANLAAAIAAGAQGALQLRAVGAGGGGTGGSATLPVSSAPGLAATPIATPVQTAPVRGDATIQLQGNFYGWNDQVIDELVAGIAAAVDDRDVRVISPTSRNAQDILEEAA